MNALAIFLDVVGGLVATVGAALGAGAVLASLRLPDFYTRAHASAAGGGALVLFGLAIASGDGAMALRLLLLAALLLAMTPSVIQFVVQSAYAAGLAPVSGVAKRGEETR